MKLMRWAAVFFLIGSVSAIAQAQVPDGGIGVHGSLNSVEITSLSSPLLFLNCSSSGLPADVAADCKNYGAQAVFSGINATGQGWGNLSVSLLGYDPATDPVVGCNGDGFFENCTNTVSHCNSGDTSCTLTVSFSQGDGSGIGCYGSNLTSSQNATCVANGIAEGLTNIAEGTSSPYFNPFATYTPGVGCTYTPTPGTPAYPPGAVCGSNDFAITIGGPGIDFNVLPDLSASLDANSPEPQTLLLVGSAVLGMMFLAMKKRILV